jgi:hypothetical protein
VHHLALRVDDLDGARQALIDAGAAPQAGPQSAVHGSRHAFVDLAGTAIEVIAWPSESAS